MICIGYTIELFLQLDKWWESVSWSRAMSPVVYSVILKIQWHKFMWINCNEILLWRKEVDLSEEESMTVISVPQTAIQDALFHGLTEGMDISYRTLSLQHLLRLHGKGMWVDAGKVIFSVKALGILTYFAT